MKKVLKKTGLVLLFLFLILGIYTCVYRFDKYKATEYISTHHCEKSHTYCAWYVMRAMQQGNCPIGILPAWAYEYALPLYGFEEIPQEGYKPQVGDIVVFEATRKHIWGHIALYNGKNWISDFKQKSMFVYPDPVKYTLFRIKPSRETNHD